MSVSFQSTDWSRSPALSTTPARKLSYRGSSPLLRTGCCSSLLTVPLGLSLKLRSPTPTLLSLTDSAFPQELPGFSSPFSITDDKEIKLPGLYSTLLGI